MKIEIDKFYKKKLKLVCHKDHYEAFLYYFPLKLVPRLSQCLVWHARNSGMFMCICHIEMRVKWGGEQFNPIPSSLFQNNSCLFMSSY